MGTWRKVLTEADKSTLGNSLTSGDTGLVVGSQVVNWVNAQGFSTGAADITEVVAGTGLTGGATSGSATLSIDYLGADNFINTLTATAAAIDAGDFILYHDGSDSNVKKGAVSYLPFTNNAGTVTSIATSGTVSGITLSGGTITSSGTITLGGSISGLTTSNLSASANIANTQLANSSITIGDSTISLGGTDATLTGLTDIDLTSGSKTIFDGVGNATLTLGHSDTTIAIAGNLTVQGTTTTINSTTVTVADKIITLADTASPTTTTGSGSGIQIETSATAAEWPEFIWTNGGRLTGWTVSNHTATENVDYPVSVIQFGSTTPGSIDSAGLGAFYFHTATGDLYIRTV